MPLRDRLQRRAAPASTNLVIHPGDPNAEVVGKATVAAEAKLAYMQRHMHLRGKDYELRPMGPSELG